MEKPQQTDIFSKDRKSVNLFEIKPRNLSGLGNGGRQMLRIFLLLSRSLLWRMRTPMIRNRFRRKMTVLLIRVRMFSNLSQTSNK